jgi:Arc/MetJ-type ribon-helix-helix transcriptional regulator
MSEQHEEVEVEVVQEPKRESTSTSVSKAINSFMESLEAALSGRGNTVMVRVNDEALEKLDMLVEAGICKSRSESAAFLLQRGIDSSAQLFDRIESVTAQITNLREGLLESVQQMETK